MKQKFLLGCVTVTASICANANSSDARFLQMTMDDVVFVQVDTVSADACRTNLNQDTKGAFTIACAAETRESGLPFTFIGTNSKTGEVITYRTKTLKVCELFHNESIKDNPQFVFEFTECR